MPLLGRSLLDTRVLSAKEIDEIFLKADALVKSLAASPSGPASEVRSDLKGPVVCCLFFEPSTRTRMSFQMAAYRLGFQVLTMELSAGSSLSKGETLTDTVLNFTAMKPDLLVVRYGNSRELDALLPKLDVPVLNAGSGTMAHPTQGLLDAYTLRQEWGSLKGKRVLIFGDVLHSRVARSNFDVLSKLGAEVGVFGPASMLPSEKTEGGVMAEYGIRLFESLDEALPWADACMGLRIQLERHEKKELDADYLAQYGLTRERLRLLRDDAVILHPGPINHGVEFASEVVEDKRSRVLKQVTNGVTIRAALLALILGR
jgi:aspartate carbamoyltransferase catalytic subunit